MAVNTAMGTPMIIEPNVDIIDDNTIVNIPYLSLLGFHSFENKKSNMPILINAGNPDKKTYIIIINTDIIETHAKTLKIVSINISLPIHHIEKNDDINPNNIIKNMGVIYDIFKFDVLTLLI